MKIKFIILFFLCFFISSTTGQDNKNINRPEEIACLQQHSGTVNCISFSPDGQFFISGGEDAKMFLWDWNTKEVICYYDGHIGGVNCLVFSPDGKFVASGGADNTLRLWEVRTGKEICSFDGHTKEIVSVAFSPNGKSLASGSSDATARFWDVESGAQLWVHKKHSSSVFAISYLSGAQEIVTVSGMVLLTTDRVMKGSRIYIQRFKFKETIAQIDSIDTSLLYCAAFSANHHYLLLSGIYPQMEVLLWDLKAHKQVSKWEMGAFAGSVCFSPDNRMAIAGKLEDTKGILVWEIKTGQQLACFIGHEDGVSSIAVSPDSRYVVSGSKDTTIRIWCLPNP